jgi:hypothetical protein
MCEYRIHPLVVGANSTDQGLMTSLKGYGKRIWAAVGVFRPDRGGGEAGRNPGCPGEFKGERLMAEGYGRRRAVTLLGLAALAWFGGASLASAQRIRIEPVPPHVSPRWTPVPAAPGVAYAPNLATDVFRYRGRYYFYWEGYWYRAVEARGPYDRVKKVPAFTFQIPPGYFKTLRDAGEVPGERPPAVREMPPAPPAPLPKVM